MFKFLVGVFCLIILSGCSASNAQLDQQSDTSTLAGINSTLPKMINSVVRLVSIFKSEMQGKTVFHNTFILTDSEKDFIDYQRIALNIYDTDCFKSYARDGNIYHYSYYDKNYVYVIDFYLSKDICTAMHYHYSGENEKFKDFIYSLSDKNFLLLKLQTLLLVPKVAKIYSDRFGDIDIQ